MGHYEWSRRGQRTENSPPVPIPEMIWQVLYSRGLRDGQKIKEHFSPKFTGLSDPFQLNGMNRAVDRLMKAFRAKEKVAIYADFDLDGTSGLALLFTGLKDLGFSELTHYQPKRLSEGYGVHPHAIDSLAESGVSLIVTIDVGITDVKAAKRAKELGLDLIVTDHHLPKEELPEAYTIVNPNTLECDSDLGHLSGCGVAFFLLLALRRSFGEEELLPADFNPKNYLDCFAIGTLTDLVPVIRENRVLCKHGLLQLAKTQRPGLKHLLKELDLWGKALTSQDVSIRFAPKLNALSRMENGILPLELYLEEDDKRAKNLVSQVMECNQLRRSRQKEAEAEAFAMQEADPQEDFVFVFSRQFHKGIVGLVATQMAQKLGLPSFVGSLNEEGVVVGSARNPDGQEISLLEAMEAAREGFTRFGGHRAAAGFEFHLDRAESVKAALAGFYGDKQGTKVSPVLHYDADGRIPQVNSQFMKWYDHLGPFGTSFDVPIFRFSQVEIVSCRSLRGGHLKLRVRQQGSFNELEALWFFPEESHPLSNDEALLEAGKVELLAEPSWNDFAGRRTLQILIKDIRLSDGQES